MPVDQIVALISGITAVLPAGRRGLVGRRFVGGVGDRDGPCEGTAKGAGDDIAEAVFHPFL